MDILQNEKSGLINVMIEFDSEKTGSYLQNLTEKYVSLDQVDQLKRIWGSML